MDDELNAEIPHQDVVATATLSALTLAEELDPGYVAGSRRLEEESALDTLLRMSTPAEQDLWRRVFTPNSFIAVVGIRDPEKKRLFETIAAIRRADFHATEREKSKAEAKVHNLSISLALVDPGTLGTSRARVIRDLNWTPWNVVLLRRGEATPEDVVVGLAMMARTREQVGDYIPQPHRLVWDAGTDAGTLPAARRVIGERILAQLNVSPFIRLPDYGEARALKVRIGPVKGRAGE